jgi:hypothetical protein
MIYAAVVSRETMEDGMARRVYQIISDYYSGDDEQLGLGPLYYDETEAFRELDRLENTYPNAYWSVYEFDHWGDNPASPPDDLEDMARATEI